MKHLYCRNSLFITGANKKGLLQTCVLQQSNIDYLMN